jgi:hypothetical protein
MYKGPGEYAGLAAVFVFGVGMLIVGFSLPATRHDQAISMRWTGVTVLTIGILAMSIMLAPTLSARMVVMSLGIALLSGAFAWHAASNEWTGKAFYHHGVGKSSWVEFVTRRGAPEKFREATNFLWGASLFCAMAGFGCFWCSRKADDPTEMF